MISAGAYRVRERLVLVNLDEAVLQLARSGQSVGPAGTDERR
jgi:hypothetical protein